MTDNAYQEYFEAQKAMLAAWRKVAHAGFPASGEFTESAFAPFKNMFEAPQDFWTKTEESFKAYQGVFELWKNLSSQPGMDSTAMAKMVDEWTAQSFEFMKKNYLPQVPDFMRDMTERCASNMEASSSMMREYCKTWTACNEELLQAFYDAQGKGPKGHIEFLESWQKYYEDTFGKLLNAPTYGKDMEFWRQQKMSFDSFIKYNIAATRFYTRMIDIALDATKDAVEGYVTASSDGTQAKSFEEFYKNWSKRVSDAYQKVLFSEELSKLSGNMVDAMSRYKAEQDKLLEMYLVAVPVPKNSDMADLYKAVHDLKEEVRSLKKEIKAHEKH